MRLRGWLCVKEVQVCNHKINLSWLRFSSHSCFSSRRCLFFICDHAEILDIIDLSLLGQKSLTVQKRLYSFQIYSISCQSSKNTTCPWYYSLLDNRLEPKIDMFKLYIRIHFLFLAPSCVQLISSPECKSKSYKLVWLWVKGQGNAVSIFISNQRGKILNTWYKILKKAIAQWSVSV